MFDFPLCGEQRHKHTGRHGSGGGQRTVPQSGDAAEWQRPWGRRGAFRGEREQEGRNQTNYEPPSYLLGPQLRPCGPLFEMWTFIEPRKRLRIGWHTIWTVVSAPRGGPTIRTLAIASPRSIIGGGGYSPVWAMRRGGILAIEVSCASLDIDREENCEYGGELATTD